MTTAQLDAFINAKVVTNGKTKAAALREVLLEIALDKDRISNLEAVKLIAFLTDTALGPGTGKSLFINGFNGGNPSLSSYLKAYNEETETIMAFWLDENGFLRVQKDGAASVDEGFPIRLAGMDERQATTIMVAGYAQTVTILAGVGTTTLLDRRIQDATSGSKFEPGHEITFHLTGNLSFAHNNAPSGDSLPYLLSGSVDFTGGAGDVITFFLNRTATAWREKSRSEA